MQNEKIIFLYNILVLSLWRTYILLQHLHETVGHHLWFGWGLPFHYSTIYVAWTLKKILMVLVIFFKVTAFFDEFVNRSRFLMKDSMKITCYILASLV
uniref:Putative ovule protein n=1 Tax=Solanum chacoense TaxID=4108 RepID=A0A0V0HF73_SOLCH